jgi:hypothetical protein
MAPPAVVATAATAAVVATAATAAVVATAATARQKDVNTRRGVKSKKARTQSTPLHVNFHNVSMHGEDKPNHVIVSHSKNHMEAHVWKQTIVKIVKNAKTRVRLT